MPLDAKQIKKNNCWHNLHVTNMYYMSFVYLNLFIWSLLIYSVIATNKF